MSWAEIMGDKMAEKEAERATRDVDSLPVELVFMGTGAACGVPTYYCECKACEEARRRPEAVRTCSSIALVHSEVTLIDTAPEMHLQMERERFGDLARVLFTHEHFDHTGGVPQLEYYVRLKTGRPLPVYANEPTRAFIATHFEGMADVLDVRPAEVGERIEADGLVYTPVAAAHCPGALGYKVEVPARLSCTGSPRTVVYLPDTSRPPKATLEAIAGADILIVDSTFHEGNWMPTQHLSIDDAVALADELGVGQAYLTHLSMQFDEPITLAELDAKLEGTRAAAARDGLRIVL